MKNIFKAAIDATRYKIHNIRQNHYVVSSIDTVDKLSVNYTLIPMKKEAKAVRIYFSKDAVSVYREMIMEFLTVLKDPVMDIGAIHTKVVTYVNGWAVMKEITKDNVTSLEAAIRVRTEKTKRYLDTLRKAKDTFTELNKDDTELIDSAYIALYKITKEFPYRKAYQHFFKKAFIDDTAINNRLKLDLRILDELINALDLIYGGYDKIGKGEEYEMFKFIQNRLHFIIQRFADLVELDIQLHEEFATVNDMVINFKIYPAD